MENTENIDEDSSKFTDYFRPKNWVKTDEKKYAILKELTLKYGLGVAALYILVVSIFQFNPLIMNILLCFFCLFTWPLVMWFHRMREYKYSLRKVPEEKIGKIQFCFMLASLFIVITSAVGLISLIAGFPPLWLAPVLNWTLVLFFGPYLLLVVILK